MCLCRSALPTTTYNLHVQVCATRIGGFGVRLINCQSKCRRNLRKSRRYWQTVEVTAGYLRVVYVRRKLNDEQACLSSQLTDGY